MSKSSERVKRWRKETKNRIVKSMGGCCQLCKYNKTNNALELHHINPIEKDFSFGTIRANPKSWKKIVDELRKCILVCSNCHKEIHEGIVDIPNNYSTFDESYKEFKEEKGKEPCPICGEEKPNRNLTCSRPCASKITKRGKIDWSKIDVLELLKQYNFNYTKAGESLDISDNAVRKRFKKKYPKFYLDRYSKK